MKGIKKHLVTLLSAVLMMTSLGIAPALADEAPLGNDDFNIVVNKKLNPKDLTLDLKIKLEDKNPTTPKVVSDLSQVFKDEGKENEKLDLVKDKADEYEMVVSENGEVEFELNYSKEVKAAEGEAEAINRDEKHNFKVNVTEFEEAKAEEPKVEEPKAEEPKVQEPAADEDVVDAPKASADGITRSNELSVEISDLPSDRTIDLAISEEILLTFQLTLKDSTSTINKGRLVIDFANSELVPVLGSFTEADNIIKGAIWSEKTKLLIVDFKDGASGTKSFPVKVKPKLTATNASPYELIATLSGEKSSTGEKYPDTVYTSKKIIPVGVSSPINQADSSLMTEIGAGSHRSITLQQNTGQAQTAFAVYVNAPKKAYFNNLIIKRIGDTFSVSNNKTFYLNSSIDSPSSRGHLLEKTSNTAVIEFGEQNINTLNIVEWQGVPASTAIGDYDATYEIYDGDTLVHTMTRKITVVPATNDVRVVSFVARPSVIDQGTEFSSSLSLRMVGSPNNIQNPVAIISVPTGSNLIEMSVGNYGNQGVQLFYSEDNQATWTKAVDHDYINKNVTHLKYDLSSTPRVDIYTTLNARFTDAGLGSGDQTIKIESLSYKDTNYDANGNGVIDPGEYKIRDYVQEDPTNPKLIQKIKVVAGTSYPNKLLTDLTASNTGGGSQAPVGEVSSFLYFDTVRFSSNSGKLDKPFVYMIIPKGMKITTSFDSVYAGKHYTRLDAHGSFNYYAGVSVENKEYKEVKLSNGDTLIYMERDSLDGHNAYYDSMVIGGYINSGNASGGTHNVKVGVGMKNDDVTSFASPTSGFVADTLDTEIQGILGATSTKVYSKSRELKILDKYNVEPEVKVQGSEDATWQEGLTTTGHVLPGKEVDFNYTLKNTGSRTVRDLEIINVLPKVGDNFIVNSGSRGSQFEIYATDDIKVLVNGQETNNFSLHYSTSDNPERFDDNGNTIPGDAWLPIKPSDATQIRSLRLKLLDEFAAGDTISLQFGGRVATTAPRNGEKAFNTIAYRANKGTVASPEMIALELPQTKVETVPSLDDGEVSGQVYFDKDANGIVDSSDYGVNNIDIELYKKDSGSFKKVDDTITIPDNTAGTKGNFVFTGLENGTYKIKVIKPVNSKYVTSGLNKIIVDGTNSEHGWLQVNGSDEFVIDDITGTTKINNVLGAVTLITPIKGNVQFVDKNLINGDGKYGSDWSIELFDGNQSLGTTNTNASGEFVLENVKIDDNKDYMLKFTNNSGKSYVISSKNTLLDSTVKVALEAGVTKDSDTTLYITDTDKPVITGPTADKAIQPTDVTYTVTDATTDVTEAWTIKNASGATVASGTKQADVKAAIAAIATAGEYTFEVVATDAAKNEAKGSTTFKFIPKTAGNEPTLNITGTDTTVELGSALPNLKTAFGVTATDKLGTTIADTNITTTEIDAIPVDGSGNVTTEGTYKVKLEVTDPITSLKTNKEVTVTVVDTTAPVLTVTPTTINLNLKKGEANALTFDEFVAKHLTMSMVEVGSQTGIKLQSDDFSVDFANDGTNTFKVYVVDNAAAKNKSNEVTITVNVEMFDETDTNNKEAINAHDFNIKLSDVSDINLISGAEAKAYDISVSPKIPVGLTVTSPLPTTVGNHKVKFETVKGTTIEVIAHVFDDINPVIKEAINAHDFNIQLSDVNDANLITGAEAAAFDVTTNTPKPVAIVKVTHAITGTGDYMVEFETANGTKREVVAHVYNKIEPIIKEAINAKDFVIQLSYVNEANVKQLSGLKAFDLNVDPAVQLNNDDIKVSALPTTTGAHNITFTTAKGSSITVKAHVFDIVDNVNKIAINANDFSMLIDDVSEAQFITNSGVEAFDVSDVNNITAITDIKVISQLPTTIGKHEVKFEATNAAGKTANIKVEASLFDHGIITPGQGSIYANNFDMKMKNMNNASVITASGVSAFDANGNAVDVKDIKLVSALPTTAGFHNFIFEANGVQVTVLGHVTARYQVVGHDLNMTMAEFKAFKANGTIEKEIIKRAEGKVINLDTGEIAELASVDYHTADITKLAPGKYDVVLNYTIDGDFIDEETPSTFGLNKTISKHVNLNITDDSNSGNGSGNGNGTGNGTGNATGNGSGNGSNTGSNNSSLPSTGMAVDATPILIGGGIIVLGLFLFLLNKKDKEEEQK